MPNPVYEYDFFERLGMSNGVAQSDDIRSLLIGLFPGAVSIETANGSDDRRGTDSWIVRTNDRTLSLDAKVRTEDWLSRGCDDLALETWSVITNQRRVPGWTRDSRKQTDYILWFWKSSRRWCILPFPPLCKVFNDKWQEWIETYGAHRQYTPQWGGYFSECVFVPRNVVWRAMLDNLSSDMAVQLSMLI